MKLTRLKILLALLFVLVPALDFAVASSIERFVNDHQTVIIHDSDHGSLADERNASFSRTVPINIPRQIKTSLRYTGKPVQCFFYHILKAAQSTLRPNPSSELSAANLRVKVLRI